MKRVYSVLIAEDESEIRRALAAMVEEHPSFRVAGCAGDGKAALRMIEALRPDVLMTDIRMPYMDGLELLQALDARGIRIKTVIISGYSSFSYARTAMKYGASDYLLKPLLPILGREEYASNSGDHTQIKIAELGNDAGIVGAALLME